MIHPRLSSGPPRRGVILLVVVLMLALFLVVGLSFVLYAEAERDSSRTNREAQGPDHFDVPPETLLAFALGQIIYDAPDDLNGVQSAMRGHSFARTMYGWHPVPLQTNPLVADANHTNNPWDPGVDADPRLAQAFPKGVPYSEYTNTIPFNGLGPLRFPQKDAKGNPLFSLPPILGSVPANAALADYDLINYMWFPGSPSVPVDNFVRDPERPGFRLDPASMPCTAAYQTPQLFAGGFNAPYTYPDRANMGIAAVQTATVTIDPKTQQPVTVNLPTPRLIMPSFVRPTANLPFRNSDPSSPTVDIQIDPTIKPTVVPFWNNPRETANPAWKYMVLRPRPGDQLLIDPSTKKTIETLMLDPVDNVWKAVNKQTGAIRLAFPPPADAGGDVKQLPGVPLYVKDINPKLVSSPVDPLRANNLIPVQNDSFWMDLGYPVQVSRNGRKFKPLFAFLALGLDERINVNVHGNVNGTLVQRDPSNKPVPPQNPLEYQFQHASNQALGRHEVNISQVLNVDALLTANPALSPQGVPQEWRQLFLGPQISNPAATAVARYGPWPSGTQQPVPGVYSPIVTINPPNPNQCPDCYVNDLQRAMNVANAGDLERSLLFPFDFDAADPYPPVNWQQAWQQVGMAAPRVTQRFALPLGINYVTGQTDAAHGFGSFPQFGPPQFGPDGKTPMSGMAAGYMSGFDNLTYDPALAQSLLKTNPTLSVNPRLNHPLLNQKLRAINFTPSVTAVNSQSPAAFVPNDDRAFGDDNMFHLLAGDYRKSTLYSLIPQNLGLDPNPNNPPSYSTALGNKVRQLIGTRSYDLDAPGAPPWVLDPIRFGNYMMRQSNGTTPAEMYPNQLNPPPPMLTPQPSQLDLQTPTADYKPGDGRANLLSRVDLGRKLVPYRDPSPLQANGQANANYGKVTPQQAALAILDRQQFAKDIFDRLVRSTGAVPPPPAPPATSPGTLTAANGATKDHYAATRYLAQLAVNIVDFIDDDDFITPFQWNPQPDQTLAANKDGTLVDNGWVYGTEAPKLLINEAYTELQNDPRDRRNPTDKTPVTSPAKAPFRFGFWLELYNPTPADSSAPAAPPATRQDPGKSGVSKITGNPVMHDRLAVQLERQSATTGTRYPVYEVLIMDDKQNIATAMVDPANTDGWLNSAYLTAGAKILMTTFAGGGTTYTPGPADPGAGYFDGNFVEPTVGAYTTAGGNPNQPPPYPKNQGFYVMAPDQDFVADPAKFQFVPTLKTNRPRATVTLGSGNGQAVWGQPQGGNAQDSLSYQEGTGPAPNTNNLADWNGQTAKHSQQAGRTHTVLLRRLACPDLDPNPLNSQTGQPYFSNKPFNPYITVDYMSQVPTYDAVQVLGAPSDQLNNQPVYSNPNYTEPNQRRSFGRRQPYACAARLPGISPLPGTVPQGTTLTTLTPLTAKTPMGAAANPVNHTFFKHNDTRPPAAPGIDPTLDFPFDWLVHLDRAPTNVMEILNVSGVRPHLLTQQFIIGAQQMDAQGNSLQTLTELKQQHLAPWGDQNARIYRALEYFTVGDRSPYPGTGGRVAGKININMDFDRDPFAAMIDARPKANLSVSPPIVSPNFFWESVNPQTGQPIGAVTDVWQGSIKPPTVVPNDPLMNMLLDPSNVSVRNRRQQLLGLSVGGSPPGKAFLPDRPFMSLAAPAVSANPATGFAGDPQYQSLNSLGQPVDLAGIASTILPYPHTDPTTKATNTIGTFYPVSDPTTTPAAYPSIDYTPPPVPTDPQQQKYKLSPTVPPYVMNELLTKMSGHVTPRSNNFAVFVTVGFFEVVDDTTFPVKLGAEITTAEGKPIRHQMFAIVDRTNLALAIDPNQKSQNYDPTGRLRQAPVPPVFMSVSGVTNAQLAGGTPAAPTIIASSGGVPPGTVTATLTIAGGLPTDYDGLTPVVFRPRPPGQQNPPMMYGQSLFLDMGQNQEWVEVIGVDYNHGTITVAWSTTAFPNGSVGHPAGAMLSTYQPGNPGPQGPIDYESLQYKAVVPYTYVIQ
jgi:hypothetical protein